jgi:hypothetical protein
LKTKSESDGQVVLWNRMAEWKDDKWRRDRRDKVIRGNGE